MTPLRMTILLSTLIGVVGPFFAVKFALDKLYPVSVSGVPVPLSQSLPAYGAAALISILCLIMGGRYLLRDREPSDADQGLEAPEDLTY